MSRITIIQCNGCGKRLGWIVAGDDTHYCPACAISKELRNVAGSRNQTGTDLP